MQTQRALTSGVVDRRTNRPSVAPTAAVNTFLSVTPSVSPNCKPSSLPAREVIAMTNALAETVIGLFKTR